MRRVFLLSLLLGALLGGCSILAVNKVFAMDCSSQAYGRCQEQGFFAGEDAAASPYCNLGGTFYGKTCSVWTWPEGHNDSDPLATQINSADDFINLVVTDLNYNNGGGSGQYFSCPYDTSPVGSFANNPPYNSCTWPRARMVGNAFIVDTMLGQDTGSFYNSGGRSGTAAIQYGIDYARAHINQWKALVKWYDSQGLIDWHFFAASRSDTRLDTLTYNGGRDIYFYENSDSSTTNTYYINFYDPTTHALIYQINKRCGNVTGDSSLSDKADSFKLEPTSGVSFDNEDNPTTATFTNTVTATIQSPFTNNVVSTPPQYPTKTQRVYTLIRANGNSSPISGVTQVSVSPPPSPRNDTDSNPSFAKGDTVYTSRVNLGGLGLQPGDQVCTTIQVWPYQGTVKADGSIASVTSANKTAPQACQRIMRKPYFQAFGGDVWAGRGVSFQDNSGNLSCPLNGTGGGISSWNQENSNIWAGAGSEFAAGAAQKVEGFASMLRSGRVVDRTTADSPSGLIFGNKSSDISGDYTGGKFASLPMCNSNFINSGGSSFISGPVYKLVDNTPGSVPNVPSLFVSQDPVTGKPKAASVTVYVQGDVYINKSIRYANANSDWKSIQGIPSFKLIVLGGDIYIDHSVTELDGLYYAAPTVDSRGITTGGTIHTCAYGNGVDSMGFYDRTNNTKNYYNNCNNQLVVNGAFVAKNVQLERTCGTISRAGAPQGPPSGYDGNSTDCDNDNAPGEVFNYSPEMWLALPDNYTLSTDFDTINGLPPIL